MKKFRVETFTTLRRAYEVMAKDEDDAIDQLDRDTDKVTLVYEADELEDVDSVTVVK